MNLQAIKDASALHGKHKLLLDSYFLEKGTKPFIGETRKKPFDASDGVRWGLKTFKSKFWADCPSVSMYVTRFC